MSKLQRALTQAEPAGIYNFSSRSSLASLKEEAKAEGWRLYYLDGSKIKDKKSYLAQIARAMHFPSYFGKNWDALNDCLTDMGWAPGAGYILIFNSPDKFIETSPSDWQVAQELFNSAIEFWNRANIPFYVLLMSSDATEFPAL